MTEPIPILDPGKGGRIIRPPALVCLAIDGEMSPTRPGDVLVEVEPGIWRIGLSVQARQFLARRGGTPEQEGWTTRMVRAWERDLAAFREEAPDEDGGPLGLFEYKVTFDVIMPGFWWERR